MRCGSTAAASSASPATRRCIRGTTTINCGGQLNALSGVDLEYNGTAVLVFGDSHTVDDGVHLKATGGGDITAGSFIDVGNGVVGSLTVTGAGSTLTAQEASATGGRARRATPPSRSPNSGVATASQLRAGTGSAVFQGNVTSGGTLRTTSTFRMGGGSTIRTVSLNVDGGTLETTGLATFDDKADLNLVNGTVNFNGGATFNAGSRIDWTGGALNLGASSTLLVDAGVVNRTITTGFIFSDNTTTRIRNGGSFITPSYFDLGNATLDMNNGGLTVGTTGGTISDWGGSGTTTTATLTNNAVATYNSGLRMGVLGSGGTTNATISGGARLVSNGSFSAGGTGGVERHAQCDRWPRRVGRNNSPRTRHNDNRFGSGCDRRAEHHARFERRDHHHHRDRSQLAAQGARHAHRRSRGDEHPW